MHFKLFLLSMEPLYKVEMSVHLVPNKMGLTGMKGMFQNRIVSNYIKHVPIENIHCS